MIKELLSPPSGTLRVIFLYVGQGESTLLIVPSGDNHDYILVDFNLDKENKGEDVLKFLSNIGKNKLIFVNTHPHDDHVKGIKEIKDIVKEVWHSGHKPSKKHELGFKELNEIIKGVGDKNVYYLRGSSDINTLHYDQEEKSKVIHKIGDIDFQVFAPAKYICEDIDNEKPEERRKRIHEQCGVIKFTYKDKSILLTGDSDKTAWKDFITPYHKESLKSDILSASHHGSRTFFKDDEDDEEIYEEHIKLIKPDYLIISAPKQKDSKHNHPHDDALEIYNKFLNLKNIYHLGGEDKHIIFDIDISGKISILDESFNDTGESGLLYSTEGKNFKTRPYLPYVY